MKSIAKIFFGVSLLVIACAEESPIPLESELLGFWEYRTMTVNDQPKEFSNYLHVNSDNTYGQCYLTGSWELTGNSLKLKHLSRETLYEVVHLSETRLVLRTHTINGTDYNYSDIAEGSSLTIVQELSKN